MPQIVESEPVIWLGFEVCQGCFASLFPLRFQYVEASSTSPARGVFTKGVVKWFQC